MTGDDGKTETTAGQRLLSAIKKKMEQGLTFGKTVDALVRTLDVAPEDFFDMTDEAVISELIRKLTRKESIRDEDPWNVEIYRRK